MKSKKYISLIITVISIFTIIIVPIITLNKTKQEPPENKIIYAKQVTQSKNIICSGKVQATKRSDITNAYQLSIDKVLVNVGEQVKKGDVIATVNKEATAQVAMSTYNALSAAGGFITSNGNIDNLDDITKGTSGKASSLKIPDAETIPDQLIARCDGVVSEVNINNDSLSTSTVLASIVDISTLKVHAFVDEVDIESVKVGQSVSIRSNGNKNLTYSGIVCAISPEAKTSVDVKNTTVKTAVEVIIDTENPNGTLKPGYNVDACLLAEENEPIIVIPYFAIKQDADNNEYVDILNKDGNMEKRIVSTGREFPDYIEVCEGISLDDKIIYNNSTN